jgi:excisionase family DNA binding protein
VPAPLTGAKQGFGLMSAGLAIHLSDASLDALAELVAARLGGQQPADAPEPWIGVDAAAEHLACPKSRIYALVSAGRIPHEKDSSRLLFRCSDLDAWLRAGGGKRP